MIDIYPDVGESPYSADGDWTNPFTVSVDGFHGQVKIGKYYVRNANPAKWYDSIQVHATQSGGGVDWLGGTQGHSWKFIPGDTQPTDEEWDNEIPNNTIDLPNIGSAGNGDVSTYLPFWIRIMVNDHTPVRSLTDVVYVDLEYEEYDV